MTVMIPSINFIIT